MGDNVNIVAISSDGNYIITVSSDNKISLLKNSSSTPVWNFTLDDEVNSVAISLDGKDIVSGSSNNKISKFFYKTPDGPEWNQSRH